MKYILLAAFAGFILAGAVFASQASAEARHGDAPAPIRYRFNGEYRGAWRASRDAWNVIAEHRGLPRLVRARPNDASRVDLAIVSACRPSSASEVTAGYRSAAGRLYVNRCTRLTWRERRKVYSHELGHVYGLEHRPDGVMPAWLEHQRAMFPTREDGIRAERVYDAFD